MHRATLVLLLLLGGFSMARADPVTLTVTGFAGEFPPGFGEAHLGIPLRFGDEFMFTADLHQASPDLNPDPNLGDFEVGRGHMTFTNLIFSSEFTSPFTGGAVVGSGPQFGDDVFFVLDAELGSDLSFALEFTAPPGTWLNTDDWAASQLARLPPELVGTFRIQTSDGFNVSFLDTIEVSPIPTPTPEPASVLLLAAGVVGMRVQRRNRRC